MKIRAVAMTVSDRCSRGEAEDVSGEVLRELLIEAGAEIVDKIIVSDDLEPLAETLRKYADSGNVNLIMTTGGTGFAPRDNTPEATRRVIEKEANGLAEAMRWETAKKTPLAMISRAVCGIRGKCVIINLPGSPKAVRECFAVVKPTLQHIVNLLNNNELTTDEHG